MFHAVPATAGADAFDRLQLFMFTPPTPFDIRRLEQDAIKLENANRMEAYTVRAGIAALKWDVAEAQRWSDLACALGGNSHVPHSNAATTFRFLNRCDIAVTYARQAAKLAPLSVAEVGHYCGLLAADGQLEQSRAVIDEFVQRVGGDIVVDRGPAEFFAAPLKRLGVSEQQLQAELRAAFSVLSNARVRHRMVSYEHEREPDGGELVSVELKFRGDIADEVRLESALAVLLCDMADWNPTKLSVSFKHLRSENVGEPA